MAVGRSAASATVSRRGGEEGKRDERTEARNLATQGRRDDSRDKRGEDRVEDWGRLAMCFVVCCRGFGRRCRRCLGGASLSVACQGLVKWGEEGPSQYLVSSRSGGTLGVNR